MCTRVAGPLPLCLVLLEDDLPGDLLPTPVLKWIGVRSSGFRQIEPPLWFNSRHKTRLCLVSQSSHPPPLHFLYTPTETTTLFHAPLTRSRRSPLTGRSAFTRQPKSRKDLFSLERLYLISSFDVLAYHWVFAFYFFFFFGGIIFWKKLK